MISTSKQHVKHLVAGQNNQQQKLIDLSAQVMNIYFCSLCDLFTWEVLHNVNIL